MAALPPGPGRSILDTRIGQAAVRASEPSPPPAPPPAWIREGRGDRAAKRHGLNLHERDALAALIAEALLVAGPIAGGDDVWAEITESGSRWPAIRRTLERRGRIRIVVPDSSQPDSATLTVVWVAERLAEATRTSEQARTNRAGNGSGRIRP
jgi:hypothetical protein